LSLEKLGQTFFAVTMTKIPLLMGFLVYELNCLRNKISALITICDYQVAINDSSKFDAIGSGSLIIVNVFLILFFLKLKKIKWEFVKTSKNKA
jgi:hypothetical protein